jgi:3-oxoacyl-[acyl-carrier-protein] synthase III
MHLVSHAHRHPVCMSAGLAGELTPAAGTTWLDQQEPDSGEGFKPPRLRQDMSALPALVDMGVAEFDALVKAGRIDTGTEHILCHYSAEHFRAKLLGRLRDAGYAPQDKRWFTNLHTAGNTGAASIFVMLDAARDRMRPGDRVLLIVPESGRFTMAFAQLTCVGPEGGPSRAELARSPLGGRWISLAAANFSVELFWLRSAAISHAADEHRDYQLLERDYAAVGGDPRLMATTSANVGSSALSAFVFHRAGQPDPVDLLGAMFVIEGLGAANAAGWADRLTESLGLRDDQLSFLRYHAEGDSEHFGLLTAALRSGLFDDAALTRITATARVTARLYALQLEELDHV